MSLKVLFSSVIMLLLVFTADAQNHATRSARIVDRTSGRAVSFEAGRVAASMTIRLPAALPTVNQILVVPVESGFTANTQWADPAGAGAVTTFVVKPADQCADAAYVDVTSLVVPVVANRLYEFTAFVRGYRTVGANNIQIQFAVPAGTTMSYYLVENDGAANDRGNFTQASNATLPTVDAPTVQEYEIRGTILTAGTAGNVQMRFRRSGGAGANHCILQNSYMRATSLP